MWQDSRLKWYINCLTHFLPLHAQFGITFHFIIQKRCDLFVLPLLLSRKPPSGTHWFGNHLSLWLVILIQLKELWDPLITLQLIAPNSSVRVAAPEGAASPCMLTHLCTCDRKTEANAVGSCLNYCSTKSTWQLAVFSMERSVPPPPPVLFFFFSKGCLHVSPVSESILIICL